jgi:hypothetical protein
VFETIRYTLAVNKALYDVRDGNLISEAKRQHMLAVAGNDVNRMYGVMALKMKAATNKHSAAALVFARLVNVAERTPDERATAHDWRAACRKAIVNSGAKEMESYLILAAMIQDGNTLSALSRR